MGRRTRAVDLSKREGRSKLPARTEPYWSFEREGAHIGYYRGARIGKWVARYKLPGTTGGYSKTTLGEADDAPGGAAGERVLDWKAAKAKATEWFALMDRTGGVRSTPYTVAEACDNYLADYLARSGKDKNMPNRLDQVKSAFGKVEVDKLHSSKIKAWHNGIATRLARSKGVDKATGLPRERAGDLADPETKRKRQASANRWLTILKAVLNHAYLHPPEGVEIASKRAWEAIAPFRNVDDPKPRYLDDAEATRLINACDGDFRKLVTAALLTGCRYGELRRAKVGAFDVAARVLSIPIAKGGARAVALSDEGTAFFQRQIMGRVSGDLLLPRDDGMAWEDSQQIRRMKDVSRIASISPAIGFHILRHTYASRLAMKGTPMAVIAAQLGHSDTRMTERHYAHLAPSFVADTFRAMFDDFGIVDSGNVVSIRGGK